MACNIKTPKSAGLYATKHFLEAKVYTSLQQQKIQRTHIFQSERLKTSTHEGLLQV